jgi:flagellar biosynthesis protein FlhB
MSAQQAGEKTEKATPKRKREAREKGQVFKSVEVISAFSLLVMFGVLSIFGKSIADGIKAMMRSFFSADIPEVVDSSAATQVLGSAILSFLKIVAPVLIAAFLCGLLFNLVQVGFNFSSKAMAPKLDKISMAQGFKRIFSKRTLIDLLKSIIKIVLLGWVAYSEYQKRMTEFPPLMGQDLEYGISAAMDILLAVAFKLGIAFAIFAPFDYMYQRWKFNKDLMMTKQELREEYKLTEGNPQTKSRIAQKQRQMSRMRMVQAVKDADVVITNPTHYAVALSYKEDKNKAPVVIAKGKDYLALRIKEEAKERGVEIVENRPVAQALYFFCDVGDEVPEDLYKAVAEILAYVYRLKKKAGR